MPYIFDLTKYDTVKHLRLSEWWAREDSNLRPMDYEDSDRLELFRAVDLLNWNANKNKKKRKKVFLHHIIL